MWICFGGISIPILLMAIPVLFIFGARTAHTEGLRAGVMLPLLGFSLLIIPSVIGLACLVIYHVFKYRLEKEDDFSFEAGTA